MRCKRRSGRKDPCWRQGFFTKARLPNTKICFAGRLGADRRFLLREKNGSSTPVCSNYTVSTDTFPECWGRSSSGTGMATRPGMQSHPIKSAANGAASRAAKSGWGENYSRGCCPSGKEKRLGSKEALEQLRADKAKGWKKASISSRGTRNATAPSRKKRN